MTDKTITFRKFSQKVLPQPDLSVAPVIKNTHTQVKHYREAAWQNYQSKLIPTTNEDEWRRTNLKGVDFASLRLWDDVKNNITLPAAPVGNTTKNQTVNTILLTPDSAKIYLDTSLSEKGLVFDTLENLEKQKPELIEKIISRLNVQTLPKFSALAGAIGFKGIYLYIPKNLNVEVPLASMYWAPGNGFAHSLHLFVYLDEGSSVTYVHESSSPASTAGSSDSVFSGLIDVYVGTAAHLNFVELQSWGENVINFTRETVEVDQDGSIDWIFGALGSKLTKNYSALSLSGKGANGKMSGFYFTDKDQHLDHDTRQNHLAANTTSDLLFKGALLDQSHSVWKGMIYVSPEAGKTDGYQSNRNLILSRQARADSIPGLEILTDDVRCTHGATVGKIDEEQVFYLQSRGLSRGDAEHLIVEGFFDPIMQRIPFEEIRNRFQDSIKGKMESMHER